jgi:hypothetical protein
MRAEVAFDTLLRQVDLLLPVDESGSPDLEREHADVVADLLAFLAERMTALHEERQIEMRDFLSWLEEQIGCPIEDLAGKSFVRAYHEQPEGVNKLLEVIGRNHPSKTALDVSAPQSYRGENPSRRRIIEGYEKSMAALRPVLLQIELTDRLIDLVVYRLYGLTGEEVELVEGGGGSDA